MAKTVIATTTIRVPKLIEDCAPKIARYHKEDVAWYIMGDTKTPPEARQLCETVSEKAGMLIRYFNIKDQEERLKDWPELLGLVPYKSYVRKLLANFIAYLEGCETLIMLDDDNYVPESDFIAFHNIVGTSPAVPLIKSSTGWFNVCEAFIEERGIPFYERGFPWGQRKPDQPHERVTPERPPRVVVDNGLVLEDPDVDAITRLFWPVRTVGVKPEFLPNFGLVPGTWCSFNNQNTAITRDLIPVYFTPHATGRNADIWTSFVICRLVEHTGEVIAYGEPLVKQFRNPHDLWKDLEDEWVNDRATDRFVALLRSVPLSTPTYLGALEELLSGCLERLAAMTDLPPAHREMMESFFTEYQVWRKLFTRMPAASTSV